jgi:hypothetical protein
MQILRDTGRAELCLFLCNPSSLLGAQRSAPMLRQHSAAPQNRGSTARGLDIAHRRRAQAPSHSLVLSLNGLLLVDKLDWERVKKLGGKSLQLRLT